MRGGTGITYRTDWCKLLVVLRQLYHAYEELLLLMLCDVLVMVVVRVRTLLFALVRRVVRAYSVYLETVFAL